MRRSCEGPTGQPGRHDQRRSALVTCSTVATNGGLVTGTWTGAFAGFFWAGVMRMALLHHITWSVNSVCHVAGARPFASRDKATNFWPLAVLSFGESWHNSHHADPSGARHGVLPGQIDPSARLIWIFERLRWKSAVAWGGIAVLLPGLANAVYKVIPLKLNKEEMRAEEVSHWYKASPHYRADSPYPRLVSTSKGVYYFLDLSDTDKLRTAEWQRKTILEDHRGIILMWDPVYGLFNSDVNRSVPAEEIRNAGWIPIHVFDRQYSQPPKKPSIIDILASQIQDEKLGPTIIFLSPLDARGNPTPKSLAIPLPDMTSLASPATQPATQPTQ